MPSLSSGQLQGIGGAYGEFDECLHIVSPPPKEKDSTHPIIKGKYCYINNVSPLPPPGSYKPGEPIDTSLFDIIKTYMSGKKSLSMLDKVKKFHNISEEVDMNEIYSGISMLIERGSNDSIINYIIGICIPSVCTGEEIAGLINKSMNFFILN